MTFDRRQHLRSFSTLTNAPTLDELIEATNIRNVAIIGKHKLYVIVVCSQCRRIIEISLHFIPAAHVDHGKTTMVDQMLKQGGQVFSEERVMVCRI
jgi:hypothetical protein